MTDGAEIDYEALTQDAMRGVMRAVLQRVATGGLPGDHHFYIAFNTLAPGVNLSRRLKEKYPDEMTIVLQHRFWDLVVREERFEVKLTFDGIPELLSVPFSAVKVFFDPSVQYGLQFEDIESSDGEPSRHSIGGRRLGNPENADGDAPGVPSRLPGRAPPAEKRRAPRKPRQDRTADPVAGTGASPTGTPANAPIGLRPAAVPVSPSGATEPRSPQKERLPGADKSASIKPGSTVADAPVPDEDGEHEPVPKPETPGAKVVNIENFRKK